MRLAAAAALVLFASTTALAQPGATGPDQPYGPPAPAPAPTYGQPYGAPQPQPQPQPQPYAPPPPQQQYPQQQYPQQQYPQQQYPQQQYPQQYPPYAPYQQQQPVGGLTRPLVVKQIKDPGTARLLSVGVTGLGFVGMLAGAKENNEELAWASLGLTLIGPSAGHIYAGEGGRALKMTLLRTAGLVTFVWGAVESTEGDCYDYCYENNNEEAEVAMYVGGAVVLISTLYDFYDSARAATRYNEKAARALTLGPTMMSSAKGGTSPGVALSGSF